MANQGDSFQALGIPRDASSSIARRPRAVGELAQGLPVSRPSVSQHLKVLREAHPVSEHREGTRSIYSLDPSGVEAMRSYLDRLLDRASSTFENAEEKEKEGP